MSSFVAHDLSARLIADLELMCSHSIARSLSRSPIPQGSRLERDLAFPLRAGSWQSMTMFVDEWADYWAAPRGSSHQDDPHSSKNSSRESSSDPAPKAFISRALIAPLRGVDAHGQPFAALSYFHSTEVCDFLASSSRQACDRWLSDISQDQFQICFDALWAQDARLFFTTSYGMDPSWFFTTARLERDSLASLTRSAPDRPSARL